jgi:plasmid stabilization system protein ParE
MVYQIIFKKRFQNKLQNVLAYIENEFGLVVAQKFAKQLDNKFTTLLKEPLMGKPSIYINDIRSIHAGNYNRVYYKIDGNRIIVLNMYDTRINPKRNKLK